MKSTLKKYSFLSGALPAVALFASVCIQNVDAQTPVTVPNFDFSVAGNAASHGGVLGEFDGTYGTGSWSVDTNAILGVILSPTVTITSGSSGNVSASGLLSDTLPFVGTVVNNDFTIYNNNIGTNFVAGTSYTLTIDFSSATTLNLGLLTGAGTGIGLRSAGADVATTLGNGLDVSLLTATTGRYTLTYVATGADAGNNIGVTMFGGRSAGGGLAGLSALGNVSYDNVTLSATAVPEPATWAAIGGGATLVAALYQRRKTRAKSTTAV